VFLGKILYVEENLGPKKQLSDLKKIFVLEKSLRLRENSLKNLGLEKISDSKIFYLEKISHLEETSGSKEIFRTSSSYRKLVCNSYIYVFLNGSQFVPQSSATETNEPVCNSYIVFYTVLGSQFTHLVRNTNAP